MTVSISYPELKALGPCEDRREAAAAKLGGARKWGATKITAGDAKAAGVSLQDVIWVASAMARSDKDVERRLRLWVADCAARVLHIYERVGKSPAPRDAIIAGRRFAWGKIDAAALDVAQAALWAAEAAVVPGDPGARNAAWAARAAARVAAWAARNVVRNAAWAAAWAARDAAAWAARDGAAWGTAWDAAWDAAWAAEERWQYDRLVAWLSDDEPEDWPLPEITTKQAAE